MNTNTQIIRAVITSRNHLHGTHLDLGCGLLLIKYRVKRMKMPRMSLTPHTLRK